MDATLRIHIGLSVDASADRLFEPIEKAASRARDKVKKSLSQGTDGPKTGNPYRDLPDQADSAAKKEKSIAEDKVKFILRINKQLNRELQQESERASARASRAAEQDARRNQRIADASALRMSGGAVRDFGRGANAVAGLYGGLAKSAGVSLDPSELFKKNVELETRIAKLANSSFNADQEKKFGQGTPGISASRKDILSTVQNIASGAGMDQADVLGALEKFVAKTGDIDTAKSNLSEMARIAKATGASLEDMMDSSGDIAIQLGDASDKGQILAQVAKVMAGQGQVGAVEYKDMASGIARIAAQQGKFKVSESTKALFGASGLTNDTGINVGVLGVLTQAARQSGGRVSAKESLNAASAFIRDLTGQTGIKRMGELGINPFADEGKTILKDPKELIMDMLAKTGGDQAKLSRLLPNAQSRSVVTAFFKDYQAGAAEGGALADRLGLKGQQKENYMKNAAMAKIGDRFDTLAKSAMSNTEVSDKFNAAMETTESKAAQFNVELSKVANEMGQKLVPALLKLAPTILKGAEAFSNITTWAVDNPFQAAGTLLGASIAKNLTQEVMRAALERALFGGLATAIGPGGATNTLIGGKGVAGATGGSMWEQAKGMGALGFAGTALAIGAVAFTTAQIGMMIVDDFVDKNKKAEDKEREQAAKNFDLPRQIKAKEQEIADAEAAAQEAGAVSPADEAKIAKLQSEKDALYEEASKQYEKLKTELPQAEAQNKYFKDKGVAGRGAQLVGEGIEGVLNMIGVDGTRSFEQQRKERAAAEDPAAMRAGFEALKSVMNGELKVRVTNPQALQAPKGVK